MHLDIIHCVLNWENIEVSYLLCEITNKHNVSENVIPFCIHLFNLLVNWSLNQKSNNIHIPYIIYYVPSISITTAHDWNIKNFQKNKQTHLPLNIQ